MKNSGRARPSEKMNKIFLFEYLRISMELNRRTERFVIEWIHDKHKGYQLLNTSMDNLLNKYIRQLHDIDLTGKPRGQKFLVRAAQVAAATIRDISDGQISLRAMSLVYTTLITIVPLLAISFSVLKGFGVHNRIEPFLNGLLEGLGPDKSIEITQKIIEFVDNVNVGVLGAIGLGLLIYAVVSLMQKIEAAFNYIWRVAADRTFAQRFSDYLSVLLMGPFLIFISAGITTAVRTSDVAVHISEFSSIGPLFSFGAFLLPWLVIALGFTFLYVYMPNTKVRISAAFIGALVAGLLWKSMGYVFSSFIAGSANYVAVYAAFATLIVLMIWLYASWLVILIGANVSFYVQNPRYLRVSREPVFLTPYMRLALGLSTLTLIARSHYNGDEPWTMEALSRKLNVPVLAVQRVLEVLEAGRVLACSGAKGDIPVYFPAVPLDTTPLEFVITVLEREGTQDWLHAERMDLTPEALSIISELRDVREKEVTARSVAQALLHHP